MKKPQIKSIIYLLLVCAALVTLAACSGQTAADGKDEIVAVDDGAVRVQDSDYAGAINRAEVGQIFILGSYEQDGDKSNGKEPIRWIVLDKNEKGILLLSEYILDYSKYAYDAPSATWSACSIRNSWNTVQAYKSFNEEELMHIRWTSLSTPANPEYETKGGPDTIDRFFLLSHEEVNRYFPDDASRCAIPTKEATKSVWYHDQDDYRWWLRTPGKKSSYAMYVSETGSVETAGTFLESKGIGSRPAIWLMAEAQRDIFGPETLQYTQIEDCFVGSFVLYGNHDIDDNPSDKEPIEWIVVAREEDKILLLSRYIIEKKRFGASPQWEYSEVREWLNSDFYTSAFSSEEGSRIQRMITSTGTDDLVFLLSAEEARYLFVSDSTRVAHVTDHLLTDQFKDYHGCGDWWTRSVSTALNGKGVVVVECNGNVRSAGSNPLAPEEYTYTDVGVRPVICVSLTDTQPDAMNMEVFGINSNRGLDNEKMPSGGSTGSSGKGKCINCNGTGYVKYYYGASDLEAYLDGYDPYTVGPCPMCRGTGKS